jgi:hypothetical protein
MLIPEDDFDSDLDATYANKRRFHRAVHNLIGAPRQTSLATLIDAPLPS